MQELLRNAIAGWQKYTDQGKFGVLFLVVLLGAFYIKAVQNKKQPQVQSDCTQSGYEQQLLLLYGGITAFLVICPVTAVILMIYQTRFYDYEWVFSMVPVTAVIAFGGTRVLLGYSRKKESKWWKTAAVSALLVALVFLCGNLGEKDAWNRATLLNSGETIADTENRVQLILDKLEEEGDTENICMWAPREILSGVRGVSGRITLLYGRDMWEAALGAYSYDVYGEDIITMYEWMEALVQANGNFDDTASAKDAQLSVFTRALECNVNCILVPENAAEYVEAGIKQAALAQGLEVSGQAVEGYYMYRLWP